MTALIPAAVSAGSQILGASLFGKNQKSPSSAFQNFRPLGIGAGGINVDITGKHAVAETTPFRQGLVDSVAGTLGAQADELGALRARVAPGISEFRASRLGEIENARRSAVGNLRENLQRRRVLGSSFGQDAITRAESEFAGQRERVAAESFLQEMEMTTQFLNQEFAARRASFQTGLDELNLQAEIATKLASGATDQLGANARMEAQLIAKENEGAGKFFGQTMQPFAKGLGDFAGSLFQGGGAGGFDMAGGIWPA